MMRNATPVVSIRHMKKYFVAERHLFRATDYVRAVDDVSLDLMPGETVGLVGESGCGKSTLARNVIRIYEPDEGEIYFKGVDITHLPNAKLHPYRNKMQMIFQDPYASLNPRYTVGDIIMEPMQIYHMYDAKQRSQKVQELLELVGLKPDHISRYPHEFSGGQRQRIGIARTLALEPEFIICDEPISALDVSIQAQIINLLERIQDEKGITYLFIAHDLTMVRHISHKIGVMYLGRLVEYGDAEEVYNHPLHPYTRALMSAAPVADPVKARATQRIMLEGEVPSPIHVPVGCPFSTRCPECRPECRIAQPVTATQNGHKVACYKYV